MTNEIRNLMFDLSEGRELYDAEQGRVVSTKEGNDALLKYCFEELGLNDKSTHREIKRAFESEKGKAFYAVIEEVVDKQIATGFKENEFFNQFVETANMADGDRNEFWVNDQPIILTVAKVAGDHHDFLYRRIRVARAA